MTTVRMPHGKRIHRLDPADPTATVCGLPAPTTVIVDAEPTCKRCARGRGR
jgi:hypothetical protein